MKMPFSCRPFLATFLAKTASLGSFFADRRGVGGVEFAIVAPLLIVGYLGSFEISVGFTVARKVSQASSTIADLLAQKTDVTKADLDNMKFVVSSIMTPFTYTNYTLNMTGIEVTAKNQGRIKWSRNQAGGTPYTAGSVITIPASETMVGTFMVRSELVVPHDIMLFTAAASENTLQKINISKTYYFRQRVGTSIGCADCGS